MRRPGELIAGRYRLGGVLGRGGMGQVYQATDEVLGRQVAVKLMLPVPHTLAAEERFLREARAAARVRDPHVVAAYDFGDHGDGHYLAMELVSGRTVSDELKREGPLAPERAEGIIRQAAAGLAAAHLQGVVHRDIKPVNLLLAADGTVKVADFGIVRFLHESTTTLTSTGQIVGTSHYLAPERALGKPAEPASDVYSLGCVLYQLLTGRPPFVADEPASIMYQHVENDPVPPSELRPELPAELDALVRWMLAKVPDRRPTAAQVADGAPPPVVAEFWDDAMTTTTAWPVRRRVAGRPLLAGLVAAIGLTASATLGIVLETNGGDLPTTNELSQGGDSATQPAAPPSPRPTDPGTSPTPTASTPGARSIPASKGGVAAKSGLGKPKTTTGDRPGDRQKADKARGAKSKKPKS